MAEAIGLGASIAGLATFGAQIVTNLRTYVSAYQRAEHKINDLSSDLALINSILTDLGASITKYEVKFHISPKNFIEAKATCERNFEKLSQALKEAKREDADTEGARKKGRKGNLGAWEKLKFALGGEIELKEFLLSIESSKSTLQLLLESFKLFILLRLHELNEEQMEDIKLLNRKVPVLVRGIQLAGLANLKPRQRQLDQYPAVEPITVMNVRMIDGSSDPASLSIRPPERSRSLEMSNVAPAPAPPDVKERVSHQNEEENFISSSDPSGPSNELRHSSDSLQGRNIPIETPLEATEAPQNKSEEFSSPIDRLEMLNDPLDVTGLSLSAPPPLPAAHNTAMDQENGPNVFDVLKHIQIPQRVSSAKIQNVFGSRKKATPPLPLARDIMASDPNISGSSETQRELPGSPPKAEMATVATFLPGSNLSEPSALASVSERQRKRRSKQPPESVSVFIGPKEGHSQPPDFSPSSSSEDDKDQQKGGFAGVTIINHGAEEEIEGRKYVASEDEIISPPSPPSVDYSEIQDYPSFLFRGWSRSPKTQSQSRSRSHSLDSASLYEGWLLEAPRPPQSTPAFTISCCSRPPTHLHSTETPLWTMHPFSRNAMILKSRLNSKSSPSTSSKPPKENPQDINDEMIAALSPDARKEINQLLHDRNYTATKRYGWKLAALTPYPSPKLKSKPKLSIRQQKKGITDRFLVILRGGPISLNDEAVSSALLGAKEDLPDRHSNPWAPRERVIERIAGDEKIPPLWPRPRSPSSEPVARYGVRMVMNKKDNVVSDSGYHTNTRMGGISSARQRRDEIVRKRREHDMSPRIKGPRDIIRDRSARKTRRKTELEQQKEEKVLKGDGEDGNYGIPRRRAVEAKSTTVKHSKTWVRPATSPNQKISYSAAGYAGLEKERTRTRSSVQRGKRIIVVDPPPLPHARTIARRPVIVDERPLFRARNRLDEEAQDFEWKKLLRERERLREEMVRKPDDDDDRLSSIKIDLDLEAEIERSFAASSQNSDTRSEKGSEHTFDHYGQGYGSGWESIPRHHHPTRLSDILEESHRSLKAKAGVAGAASGAAAVVSAETSGKRTQDEGEEHVVGYSGQEYGSGWDSVLRQHHRTRLPEIGYSDGESDETTNPSIIQEPLGGVAGSNRDYWSDTPASLQPKFDATSNTREKKSDANLNALEEDERSLTSLSSGSRRLVGLGLAGLAIGAGAAQEGEYQKRLEEDLRKPDLDERRIAVVLEKDEGVDLNRPTYTRMSRKHLSLEALNKYRVDYELDQDPDYVLIKRWVPEYEQDFLWEKSREVREERKEKFPLAKAGQKTLAGREEYIDERFRRDVGMNRRDFSPRPSRPSTVDSSHYPGKRSRIDDAAIGAQGAFTEDEPYRSKRPREDEERISRGRRPSQSRSRISRDMEDETWIGPFKGGAREEELVEYHEFDQRWEVAGERKRDTLSAPDKTSDSRLLVMEEEKTGADEEAPAKSTSPLQNITDGVTSLAEQNNNEFKPQLGGYRDPAVEADTERESRDTKTERWKSTSSRSSKPHRKTRPPSAHENIGFPKFSTASSSRRDGPTKAYVSESFSIQPATSFGLLGDTFADEEPLGDEKVDRDGDGNGEEEGIGGMSVEEARRVMSEFLKGFSTDEAGVDIDVNVDRLVGKGTVQEETNQEEGNDKKEGLEEDKGEEDRKGQEDGKLEEDGKGEEDSKGEP